VVLERRAIHSFLSRLVHVASFLLVSWLAIGCAGYTQKLVPDLSLSTSSLNFQSVVVGQTTTKTFSISNTGTGPLQISALSISGKQFSLTGPSVPRTILPANSLTYTLTFAPSTSGSASASVDISTNTVSKAASVALTGSGEKPFANLVISPTVVNFGNLALKTTSTQNVTLQNTGDINLSLQGLTVSGAGFGYSDLSPGFSLAPNQKVTFQVWFSPKVAGPATATLSLLSANLSSPGTLTLSGDGVSSAGSPTPPPTTPPPTTRPPTTPPPTTPPPTTPPPTTPPPTTPPPTTPPPATQHTVALSWGASSSQVIGYRVYRSENSGGSYSPLNGTAVAVLNYSDSTVASGSTYYYVVTAVDSSGTESAYSNQATAVIP
jgi:HYDIN/CFA65/VesB-like, Ig-like domain